MPYSYDEWRPMWTVTLDWSEEEASFLSGSVDPVQLAVDTFGKSF